MFVHLPSEITRGLRIASGDPLAFHEPLGLPPTYLVFILISVYFHHSDYGSLITICAPVKENHLPIALLVPASESGTPYAFLCACP